MAVVSILLSSFLLSWFLLRIFVAKATTYNLIDVPDGNIKRHEKPIPHVGGLSIYLSFVTVSLGVLLCFYPAAFLARVSSYYSLYTGATLFLIVGLIDDRVCLKPYQKALGQCVAALSVVCLGTVSSFSSSGIFFCGDEALLSILWMVTIANAFNLIDIMDGLAATVAFFILVFFLIVSAYQPNPVLTVLLLSLLGSLCAFFVYNKPPARVYLGDAGALFIGGFLSMVPFFLTPQFLYVDRNSLIFVLLFAIPLLELVGLVIMRTHKGIPFYLPSRDHFALRLKDRGWTTQEVLFYVACMSLILLIVSYAFFVNSITILFYGCAALFFILIWIYFLTSRQI